MEKQLIRTIPYKGTVFNVRHDKVSINDIVTSRDVVEHSGGVGILAILNNKLLLVEQYRYAIHELTLEIPAGKAEKYLSNYECALQELEQETGYKSNELKPLCNILATPGYSNEQIQLYYTNEIYKVHNPIEGDEDENITVHLIDLEEVMQMIQNHFIRDAKTIIAVQQYYIHKNKTNM